MKTIKHFFLALLYIVVLSTVLYGVNWLTELTIRKIIGPLFLWFLDLQLIWKLLLLFFGGTIMFGFFLGLINRLAAIVSTLLNIIFPYNKAMVIISYILVILNIIVLEIAFWPLFNWDFWIICLWFIIAAFILQVNLIFIFRNPDEL